MNKSNQNIITSKIVNEYEIHKPNKKEVVKNNLKEELLDD